jgi:hypothetical protein
VSVEFADRIGLGARSRGDFLLAAAGNSVTLRDRAESVRAAAWVWRNADAGPVAWLVFLLRLTLPDPVLRAAVSLARATRRAARTAASVGRPGSERADRLATSNRHGPPPPGRVDKRRCGVANEVTYSTKGVQNVGPRAPLGRRLAPAGTVDGADDSRHHGE